MCDLVQGQQLVVEYHDLLQILGKAEHMLVRLNKLTLNLCDGLMSGLHFSLCVLLLQRAPLVVRSYRVPDARQEPLGIPAPIVEGKNRSGRSHVDIVVQFFEFAH